MNQHPDDLAVDKFAAAMKEKLAQARAKGRCGWEECAPADLSAMLYEHVAKGDPRDVANFCMFLWNLGQPITQCHKALDVAQSWEPDEETCKFLADMITADPDQITRVGFHLGYAKDDDGKLVHGFSVYEAEYPEEGVHTLVETKPIRAAAIDQTVVSVLLEVAKATAKFPTWPTDPFHALAVLGEEFGELTQAVLQSTYEPHKSTPEDVKTEAIQTAAMAVRFLMSLNQYQFQCGEQHNQAAITAAEAFKGGAA